MLPIEIDKKFLTIGDVITITFTKPFFYQLTKEDGKKYFETGYNKEGQKGWKLCQILTGTDCGARYDNNEIKVIKIRATEPWKMAVVYGHYLEFYPSEIESLTIVKKAKGTILDKLGHALTKKKLSTAVRK